MAETIHFFSETSISQQDHETSFGPVNNEENIKYRVSCLFKGNGSIKKAYAVTLGSVIVVPSTDSNRVNILLRPDNGNSYLLM